jgi:2-polyprenyl-6-methoxyphenol hydroxylase-like FAD-dependent oxidoreductase
VPQSDTERVLATHFNALAAEPMRRGHRVLACTANARGATLLVASRHGTYALAARFVVGCDGKHSLVRTSVSIGFRGGAHAARFVMSDVLDETPFGTDAAIFLTRNGLVECFPMPRGMRRWVVELRDTPEAAGRRSARAMIAARTGFTAPASAASMVSSFTAEHYLATRFFDASLALAGDAAHVLSPIGGQGMNLGWLDAAALADVLGAALAAPDRAGALLAAYGRDRRGAARAAARRARLYLRLGRARRLSRLRDAVVEVLLSEALVGRMAKVFTMHGLASGPIA